MPESRRPLVSICCIVYNHEPYLRDCLEGFLMQRCSFPFEVLIHDDASQDRSAEIIRAYAARHPEIFKPICQSENQYSKGLKINPTFNFPRAEGEYIALCEGDDYWTDPLKLQKQVDFLVAHPECGLVYTDVDFREEESGRITPQVISSGQIKRSHSFAGHLRNGGFIAPCTWLFRREHIPQTAYSYVDGTFPLALDIWARSEVGFIDNSTAVYRILRESVSHTISLEKRYRFRAGILRIQKDYMAKYPEKLPAGLRPSLLRKAYGSLLRPAVVLDKQEMIEEMELFYLRYNPAIWLYLKLFRRPLKVIQSYIYRRKGFQW